MAESEPSHKRPRRDEPILVTVRKLGGEAFELKPLRSETVASLQVALTERLGIQVGVRPTLAHHEKVLESGQVLDDVAQDSRTLELTLTLERKEFATVHQVNVAVGDADDACAEIARRYPKLLAAAAHGDLIENKAEAGYRMCGVYIVFRRGEETSVQHLDSDAEEYGGIPAWCEVVTEFPFNYWDLGRMQAKQYRSVDDPHEAEEEADPGEEMDRGEAHLAFCWHTEDCVAPIRLPPDWCAAATDEEDHGDHVVFKCRGYTWKVMGAGSLRALRERGVVLGTEEALVGCVEEY